MKRLCLLSQGYDTIPTCICLSCWILVGKRKKEKEEKGEEGERGGGRRRVATS